MEVVDSTRHQLSTGAITARGTSHTMVTHSTHWLGEPVTRVTHSTHWLGEPVTLVTHSTHWLGEPVTRWPHTAFTARCHCKGKLHSGGTSTMHVHKVNGRVAVQPTRTRGCGSAVQDSSLQPTQTHIPGPSRV